MDSTSQSDFRDLELMVIASDPELSKLRPRQLEIIWRVREIEQRHLRPLTAKEKAMTPDQQLIHGIFDEGGPLVDNGAVRSDPEYRQYAKELGFHAERDFTDWVSHVEWLIVRRVLDWRMAYGDEGPMRH